MGRLGRVLAVLTLGGFLLLGPTGPAISAAAQAAPDPAPAAVALAPQQAPPGPDLSGGDGGQPQGKQRIAIGIGGIVLIAAVLLSRRARKKPMFGFKWKS